MSVTGAPNIVEDGLTFCIDPANPRSYISGSSDTFNMVNFSNTIVSSDITGSLENDTFFTSSDSGKWFFDGVDDYIRFNTGSDGNWGTDSWSVSVWFSTTSSIENSPSLGLVSKRDIGNNQEGWGIALRGSTYNGIMARLTSGSASNLSGTGGLRDIIPSTNITSSLSDGKGHNLTVIYDHPTLVGSLYVDGEFSNENTTFNSGFTWENYVTASNLVIGAFSTEGSLPFHGAISNVSFYHKALSSQEITQNYNALKHRFGL